MRELLHTAIGVRRRVNSVGKSYPGQESVQFMKNLESWLAKGADPYNIASNHDVKIRIMLTPNLIKKYEKLRDRRNS